MKKVLTVTAAAAVLALMSLSPSHADEQEKRRVQGTPDPSIPTMEKEQLEGGVKPDVDARASRGPDLPIPEQEKQQLEGGVDSRALK